MKIIYTFGDSHSCMFAEVYRQPGSIAVEGQKVIFADRSCGVPMTAYSFNRYDSEIRRVLASIDFKSEDEMWFILGEIDIRFHIFYHHQRLNIPLDESIERVAHIYVQYVKKLIQDGYPIHIVSVVPPQPNPSPYFHDPSYQIPNPIRGEGITVEDRVYMTKKLNDLLEAKCLEEGIVFRNIYPYLVDPETGCNNPSMTRDEMHYYYVGDLVIEKLGLGESNAS
jgi:hypothetical protein